MPVIGILHPADASGLITVLAVTLLVLGVVNLLIYCFTLKH